MNIKQLQYFIAIAESGTISAAAKQLGISQPPLSAQLKQLEESLHVKLIERGARKVTLTEAGKILYKRANAIVSLSNMTIRELDHFQNGQGETIRLGMISSVGSALYQWRLQFFKQMYPSTTFEIYEGNTYELLEQLNEGVIDIAIVRTPFQSQDYQCYRLEPEPMYAIATQSFLQAYPEQGLSILDLEGLPIIIYRRMEHVIKAAFQKKGINPLISCLNDDARTSLMWAEAGMGIAIVPKSIISMYTGQIKLIKKEITDTELYTQITAIKMKNRSCPKRGLDFLDLFSTQENKA